MSWLYNWITKDTDPGETGLRDLLSRLQHGQISINNLLSKLSIPSQIENKLRQAGSIFTKFQTLLNTDFFLTYLIIVFNGIKEVSGESPAYRGDNLIEYCFKEIATLFCPTNSEQEVMQTLWRKIHF